MTMIKRLAASIREYKRDTILTPLLMIGEVVCECVIPLYTAQLVNSIQAGCTRDVIFYYGLRLLGLALLSLCFGMAAGWFCAAASTGFAKNLRHDLFYRVQNFSFANIDQFSTSSLVTRLTTDVSNVQMAFMMIIRTAVRAPLMLIFSVIMSIKVGKELAFVFAAAIPIVAYLLKPISMTELTAELAKIHKKIVARLASLTDHRGPGERQLMTASLLLDEFCRRGEIVARLAQSGVAISTGSTIISGAIRAENADPADLLSVSERVLSRVCGCCGFCADERVVLLLASETGFGALYGALDELRQAIRRTCGAEAQIGLSKEYASVADGHAAYLEAMEALQATHSGEVQAAGGWDDMQHGISPRAAIFRPMTQTRAIL